MEYPIFTEDLLEHPPLVIWCPRKELIPQLVDIFEKHGMTWNGGGKFALKNSNWLYHEDQTTYHITRDRTIQWASRRFYQDNPRYGTIYEFVDLNILDFADVEDLL